MSGQSDDDDLPPARVINAPAMIHLMFGLYGFVGDVEFADCYDPQWCEGPPDPLSADIAYVRAGVAHAAGYAAGVEAAIAIIDNTYFPSPGTPTEITRRLRALIPAPEVPK